MPVAEKTAVRSRRRGFPKIRAETRIRKPEFANEDRNGVPWRELRRLCLDQMHFRAAGCGIEGPWWRPADDRERGTPRASGARP